jgi:hypothetical protein
MSTRLTRAQLEAQLAETQAALAEAQKKKAGVAPKLSYKASKNKGVVSIYGTGRFPINMYPQAAERVAKEAFGLTHEQFAASPIGQFIEANRSSLSFKKTTEVAA